MKAMGAIPADYLGCGEQLKIGGFSLRGLAEAAGQTPFFVYDFAIVAARITRLRKAMPGVDIHYAVKANPLPRLVQAIATLVDGLDVASAGELAVARGCRDGIAVSFAGPGKRDAELEAAITSGTTINLESMGETRRALAIADRLGITPKLAVRVNPDFELRGSGMRMGGRASPFGIDAAEVPRVVATIVAAGADWRGFHIFAGSQSLDTGAIIEAQAKALALVASLAAEIGLVPPLVNLGGGFGVPYFAGETPIDVERIGERLHKSLIENTYAFGGTRFCIELGRWLVAEAGVYLTRIVDRKESMGETFLVTDGGLHHQLAASGNLGAVVRRNYPLAVANRFGSPAEEAVTVVGCLCTPLDRLGDRVMLPRANVGDLVALFMAGAYGVSASPTAFLGHPAPPELIVGLGGTPNAIFTS